MFDRKIEGRFFWSSALICLLCGCSTARPPLGPEFLLAPSLKIEESQAFQKAASLEPGSREAEQARIEYLLERVADSPYNFIRNGSRYNGKRAEVHLRWKYLRNQQKVATGEEFIKRIATRSKISGEQYLVVLPDKRRLPLRDFLLYELRSFDQALETKHSPHS